MKNERARILIAEEAAGRVRRMHPHLKKKIRAAFQALLDDPFAGKALKDELAGLRSFRVGRHRVINRVAQRGQVQIVTVGSRESIYEETYRLLRKEER